MISFFLIISYSKRKGLWNVFFLALFFLFSFSICAKTEPQDILANDYQSKCKTLLQEKNWDKIKEECLLDELNANANVVVLAKYFQKEQELYQERLSELEDFLVIVRQNKYSFPANICALVTQLNTIEYHTAFNSLEIFYSCNQPIQPKEEPPIFYGFEHSSMSFVFTLLGILGILFWLGYLTWLIRKHSNNIKEIKHSIKNQEKADRNRKQLENESEITLVSGSDLGRQNNPCKPSDKKLQESITSKNSQNIKPIDVMNHFLSAKTSYDLYNVKLNSQNTFAELMEQGEPRSTGPHSQSKNSFILDKIAVSYSKSDNLFGSYVLLKFNSSIYQNWCLVPLALKGNNSDYKLKNFYSQKNGEDIVAGLPIIRIIKPCEVSVSAMKNNTIHFDVQQSGVIECTD